MLIDILNIVIVNMKIPLKSITDSTQHQTKFQQTFLVEMNELILKFISKCK